MAGLLQRVAGGALKGLGDSMVEQAKQRREDALTQLGIQVKREDAATAHQYDMESIDQRGAVERLGQENQSGLLAKRDAAQHDYRMAEGEADATNRERVARTTHDLEANDATGTVITGDGKIYQSRRGGGLTDTGVTTDSKTDSDMLAQAESIAATSRTTQDADGNKTVEKVVDPKKAIEYLVRSGRPDLARRYGYFPPVPEGAIDLLRKKPELRKDFDQKYGPGAASKALGQK